MFGATLNPRYLVSFYVATCGQNGNNLGCDEKEIVLLVYNLIHAQTGEILATKQILVRPNCDLNEKAPPALLDNTRDLTAPALESQALANSNAPASSLSSLEPSNGDTQAKIAGSIPVQEIYANGKPLGEALDEFNSFLRSQSIDPQDIVLVTDGQLPLRQCLHPEVCTKGLILSEIYNKFIDLRKEYQKFKSGDLSKALVPVKDVKKLLQMPVKPIPEGIAEIISELNLDYASNNSPLVKESYDMAYIIQHMLKSGYKFTSIEQINLILEPGICSIDDNIDGNCIVRARGLPWQSSDQDIAKFFRGLNVAKGGVALCLSPLGRRNGEALIRFVSQEHRDMALKRHKHHIGPRYIEVYRATGDDFLSVAGGASSEAQAFLSKGAQVIIRMRGLPYDCTAKQVLDFFTTGDSPCDILDGAEGVLFVKKADGRATGDAFVLFANESDAPRALSRHRESIGQRYIELFRSTTAEVQQVLNRCMDPKTYETNNNVTQAPLIPQLPHNVPMSLLPQHLITSGTTKNCVRLRGLPYEAMVEHILHFLDEFAKHIIFQGVHMVINAQAQPSGEAFIQMDSEEAAKLCAQRKHNQFMVFGKKYRYIEVFQCSGDDMNMVLNGGLQSAVVVAQPHASGSAKQSTTTTLLPPGMLVQPQQANAQNLCSHNHSHLSHVNHTLQTQPSMAPALALGSSSQIPLSALCPPSGLGASPTPPANQNYQSFVPQASMTPSSTLSQTHGLISTPNSLTAALPTAGPGQLALPSLSMSNPALAGLPFNFHLPTGTAAAAASTAVAAAAPSNNSALLAQQQAQAQFIAQQSLLARQQNAAVAMEPHQFYTNLMNPLFLPQSSPAGLSGPIFSGATAQPQFMFMPRPYFNPMSFGYSMASPNFTFGNLPPASPHPGTAPTATATVTNLQQSVKRSYENAFQQDSTANANSVPKRTFNRPPGNGYYQFYNP